MLLTIVLRTFEGGPKKRENAGDASRRVRKTRKTTIFVFGERAQLVSRLVENVDRPLSI